MSSYPQQLSDGNSSEPFLGYAGSFLGYAGSFLGYAGSLHSPGMAGTVRSSYSQRELCMTRAGTMDLKSLSRVI